MSSGAPWDSIATRLRHIAKLLDIVLVVICLPDSIMCIFGGTRNPEQPPDVHHIKCDRRLSFRTLRRVNNVSEKLAYALKHYVQGPTTKRICVATSITELDIILMNVGQRKATRVRQIFDRFVLSAYSLPQRVLPRRRKEPFTKYENK
jgi:hypothetical protein